MTKKNQSLLSLFQIGLSIHHLNLKAEQRLGISLGQWCLLRHLVDMPATSAFALAKAVGVHPSTLTQTLKRLNRRELIFITEDPKDSRRKLISITRKGKTMLDETEKALGRNIDPLAEMSTELVALRDRLASQVATF